MNHFFYSLIGFITALFFILLGVMSVLMSWFPAMRADLIQFLLENGTAVFLFGLAFMTIGIVMVINIVLGAKNHYYQFKIGRHTTQIDEDLIQKYIQTYFGEIFPKQAVPCRLIVRKNRLHITVDLPYVPASQQSVLMEKIQQDLNELLGKQIGYTSDYYLSTSFQPEKTSS